VADGKNMQSVNGLQKLHAFWNTEPCGTHFIQRFADERDFLSKYLLRGR
jgi:hypothetical protein